MVPRNTCDCGASRRPLGIQKKRLSQALSKNIVGGVVFYDTGTYMLSAYYRTSYRQPHNMYQVCVNSFGKVSCLGLQVSFRRCHRLCRCVVGLCASYTTLFTTSIGLAWTSPPSFLPSLLYDFVHHFVTKHLRSYPLPPYSLLRARVPPSTKYFTGLHGTNWLMVQLQPPSCFRHVLALPSVLTVLHANKW